MAWKLPVLLQVILPLEGFSAYFAREGDVIFVAPLVYHQVVGFGEPPLTEFADELALGSHFPPELPPLVRLHLHYREHLAAFVLKGKARRGFSSLGAVSSISLLRAARH